MAEMRVIVESTVPEASASLDAATTGTGEVYDTGRLASKAVFVLTADAAITAGAVALEGSLDGSAYVDAVTAPTLTTDFASAGSKAYTGSSFRYYRVRVTTDITGGPLTATILAA